MLVGCSSDDAGTKPNEGDGSGSGEPEAVEGGKVTLGMHSTPENQFNPIFYTSSYDANILNFTHESLMTQDEDFQYQPELAKDWEFSEDKREITFSLRDDVKWHDGEPFTADDVVFTYEMLADPGYVGAGGVRTTFVNKLQGYEEYAGGEADTFAGVEKVDDLTVKFVFGEPSVKALSEVNFSIIPKHVFEDVAIGDMPEHEGSIRAGEVIGTGPFKLTDMIENEQYVLEANKDYWKGAPKLDSVVWRVVDQSVAAGMLEQGELDFFPEMFPPDDAEDMEGKEGFEVFSQPKFGYQYLGMKVNYGPDEDLNDLANTDLWKPNPKLENKEFRQAIMHAIDRQSLIDGFLRGYGSIIDAPFPPASWAYNPDEINGLEYNLEKAKSLLEKNGYVDTNGDGYVEDPDGNELTLNLHYPLGNKVRERSAPVIVEQLKEAGIRIELKTPMETAPYFTWISEKNSDEELDLFLAGWSLGSGDPDPSTIHQGKGTMNYSRFYDEAQDKLLEEALDPEKAWDNLEYRTEKYTAWAQMFSDNAYATPLYIDDEIHVYTSRLKGIVFKPFSYSADSHEWYLTKQ